MSKEAPEDTLYYAIARAYHAAGDFGYAPNIIKECMPAFEVYREEATREVTRDLRVRLAKAERLLDRARDVAWHETARSQASTALIRAIDDYRLANTFRDHKKELG